MVDLGSGITARHRASVLVDFIYRGGALCSAPFGEMLNCNIYSLAKVASSLPSRYLYPLLAAIYNKH